MAPSGLFAHLAARFGSNPEILAAEALAYLLTTAPAMRDAVIEVCSIAAPGIARSAADVQFRASGPWSNGEAPTLLGIDAEGVTRFVVAPRFWSALAEDQPHQLLQQLTMGRGGVLLVLAPAGRFTSLWAELRRRCRLAGLPVHGDHAIGDPIRWTRVGQRQVLILASWSALVAAARSRLGASGDRQTMLHVDQLAGLCRQLDTDTFAPLTTEELAGGSVRRLAQLFQLVDDLAQACEDAGLGAIEEAGWTGSGSFGRRLRFGTTRLAICLSVPRWANLRETPYWLLVYDTDGRPARGVDARLEPLASEIPPRLLRDGETDCPLVPLFPPVGADRDAVLAELVRQVSEVARFLGEGPTSGFGSRA